MKIQFWTLFSSFIFLVCRRFLHIIAQNKDVFVVSLHEITFACYLGNGLWIAIQILQIACIRLVALVIFSDLLLQLFNLILLPDALYKTVFIDKTNDKHTKHHDNVILETADELPHYICNLTHELAYLPAKIVQIENNTK